MIQLPDLEGLQDRVRLGEHTGPGPRLRAAREACGFEIDDIAKQLRLHPHIIDDLERDTFSDHLALVFVRGYLRAYATLIGLDPNQVVDEFNALGFQEERDLPDLKGKTHTNARMRHQNMRKSSMSPGLKWTVILGIVALFGAIFVAYNHEPEVQLNAVPSVVSDSTEIDPNAPPEATDDSTTTTTPAAATTATTPQTTAPGAARPSGTTGTPTAATPAPAAQAAPVAEQPAAAPAKPAPAPAPSYEDDDDYDTDARIELDLPKPGRSS